MFEKFHHPEPKRENVDIIDGSFLDPIRELPIKNIEKTSETHLKDITKVEEKINEKSKSKTPKRKLKKTNPKSHKPAVAKIQN